MYVDRLLYLLAHCSGIQVYVIYEFNHSLSNYSMHEGN